MDDVDDVDAHARAELGRCGGHVHGDVGGDDGGDDAALGCADAPAASWDVGNDRAGGGGVFFCVERGGSGGLFAGSGFGDGGDEVGCGEPGGTVSDGSGGFGGGGFAIYALEMAGAVAMSGAVFLHEWRDDEGMGRLEAWGSMRGALRDVLLWAYADSSGAGDDEPGGDWDHYRSYCDGEIVAGAEVCGEGGGSFGGYLGSGDAGVGVFCDC